MEPKLVEARSVLVLGGARSGKSAYAQKLTESGAPERLYLATAEAGDAEMAARIARHRAERGGGWTTVEEPLALAGTLHAVARPGRRAILVDCITLWLANLMSAGWNLEVEIARLITAIGALEGPAVFVSNEVGLFSCRRPSSAVSFATGRAGPIARSRGSATRWCSSRPDCQRS